MRGMSICVWLLVAILSNCLIGSYIVVSRQVELHLEGVDTVPPMRAITYLKIVSTIVFFLVVALPDLFTWLYQKWIIGGVAEQAAEPLLDGDVAKPTLWIRVRWTVVIIIAAFLRIASETVAPYFAKAYLVLFVQMWAPLLVAVSGRVIFRVTLPYGFVPASVAMMLAAGVTLFGAAEVWKEDSDTRITLDDVIGMLVSLMGVLSIVVILYVVSWGKQILGDRFILFLIMSSMLLFAPWLSLILEPGSLLDFMHFTLSDWAWVVGLGLNNFCMVYFQNLALYNLGAPLVSIFIPLRLLVSIIGSEWLLDEPLANWVEALGLTLIFLVTLVYLFTQYLAAVRRARELSELGEEENSFTRLGTPLAAQQTSQPVDVLSQE